VINAVAFGNLAFLVWNQQRTQEKF